MSKTNFPLEEISIHDLFNGPTAVYEIPIYQRNYAWKESEISALVQDIKDACDLRNIADHNADASAITGENKTQEGRDRDTYYIGTLVTYSHNNVYEVIDGQQRLTTLSLILSALHEPVKNRLTYRARKKSSDTLERIRSFAHQTEKAKDSTFYDQEEVDKGIREGYELAEKAILEIVGKDTRKFRDFLLNQVHLIHYHVPKDIDLNHYFEVMNSRGEQLEKHEIIKARMIEHLGDKRDRDKFALLWENCSTMNVYIQQSYHLGDKKESKNNIDSAIFGEDRCDFIVKSFEDIPALDDDSDKKETLASLLETDYDQDATDESKRNKDLFQPIIDFPNFLLTVLKIKRMLEEDESGFNPSDFVLDDKNLIQEFGKFMGKKADEKDVKRFGYLLLKARYFLDNYIVHHSNSEDIPGNNPWNLQTAKWDNKNQWTFSNTCSKDQSGDAENSLTQLRLVQLLSMFEVSFGARQRKNYLVYCLYYLFRHFDSVQKDFDFDGYSQFLSKLAEKYFKDIYLDISKLNELCVPKPSSFDETIGKSDSIEQITNRTVDDFNAVYEENTDTPKRIPLFVFNYLDYKLWDKYATEIRGKNHTESSSERQEFFAELGCSDFDIKTFQQFYFSRTRGSLEHYYPQANARKNAEADAVIGMDSRRHGTANNKEPDEAEINRFGNFAMIGSETNSAGSNWSPKTKRDHYLDASGKLNLVSVASLKFMIMMQMCRDNVGKRVPGEEWGTEDIEIHQNKMMKILF